jgi:hypothetical protein
MLHASTHCLVPSEPVIEEASFFAGLQPPTSNPTAYLGPSTLETDNPNLAVACPSLESLPPDTLAAALVDQLQQHHGCAQHSLPTPPAPPCNTVSLSSISRWASPDLLQPPVNGKIAQHPTAWDSLCPPPQRRKIFTGLGPVSEGDSPPEPPLIDLEADTVPDDGTLRVALDIDSAGGFASSLAVAREGIYWKARRAPVSNLRSSLHMPPLLVEWFTPSGKLRRQRKPLHRIPHLPFGRLAGFSEVELYIIFPRQYDPALDNFVITREAWELWTNNIFLPAVHTVYPSSVTQHLPASAEHIERNAHAPSREARTSATVGSAHAQDFHHRLQPDGLEKLWAEIQRRISHDGHSLFLDAQIVLTGKNLKLSTQRQTWSGARDAFLRHWSRTVDLVYLQQDFYDIAKEVLCHRSSLHPPAADEPPLTLCWRRCCLDGFCQWITSSEAAFPSAPDPASSGDPQAWGAAATISADAEASDADQPSFREEEITELPPPQTTSTHDGQTSSPYRPPARWRVEHYPQSLVRDHSSITIAPPRSSPIWKRGLRYIQQYNTSKEIFAAGNHYPFANKALDTLALDPAMVRTWQHVGGAISHSPIVVLQAYLHTKMRCHAALSGCRFRSYGTREEYRVTGAVFQAMDAIFRARGVADTPLTPPSTVQPFFVYPTSVMIDWWRWNINKLCLGFEMTYSIQPRNFVHWEHTRVMMMFLQGLSCAFGGQGAHLRR